MKEIIKNIKMFDKNMKGKTSIARKILYNMIRENNSNSDKRKSNPYKNDSKVVEEILTLKKILWKSVKNK
jgi:hypothetical protein